MRSLVLVADEPSIVGRVRLATRYAAGIRVAATLDGRAPIGAEIAALQPDVVVVDEMCQRMNTLARLREVSSGTSGATVLLLVSAHGRHVVEDAFAAGAHAVLRRDAHAPALGALIGEIALGHLVLSAQHGALPERPESGPAAPVTALGHLRLLPDQPARRTGTSA